MLIQRRRPRARWLGSAVVALSLSLVGPAFAVGTSVTAATEVQKADAGKSFQRGAQALAGGQLDKALEEFQRSLDVVNSPNTRLMLARTLVKLGRPVEAYAQLEQTVTDAEQAAQVDKKYGSAAEAARTDLTEVRSQVGLVTVVVTGATVNDSLSVAGKDLERAAWIRPVAVAPGKVSVVLRTANGEATREVEVTAGGSATAEVAAPAPPEPVAAAPAAQPDVALSTESSSTRTWGFVTGGIGLAGLVTFGVFGGLNQAKYRKLQEECINYVCSGDLESERDTGRTYQTIANIGLAVGVFGVGTGAVLLLVSGSESENPQQARLRDRPAAGRGPRIGIGPGYVDVSGRF